MSFRLRLIPALMIAAFLLLGIKVADLHAVFVVHAASAEEGAAPAAAQSASTDTGAPADPKGDKPAEPAGKDGAAISGQDPMEMSPAEIEVLQKLSDRRAELDRRAADMAQKEVLLEAAEQRMDDKITQLTTLRKEVTGAAEQQDQQDEQHLKSLVKIYEAMKPADAAHILEQLDVSVTVNVLQRMKEAKASPILAAMDAAKAKQVTVALAGQRDKPPQQSADARQGQPESKP